MFDVGRLFFWRCKVKTVIMAGGKGTRIQSVYSDIPKPMIPIKGKPVLEREIASLAEQGFRDIIITVSHFSNQIIEYFNDGHELGVSITYYIEDKPLGNAGALFFLQNELREDFLLINGDAVFDIDFQKLVNFHKKKNALITLFTHPNDHPYDSSLILSDSDNKVVKWISKEDPHPTYYNNQVNAGIHVISPKIFDFISYDVSSIGEGYRIDLDRQIIKPLIKTGLVYCYNSPEYVHDMGTPERLAQVICDWNNGLPYRKSLKIKQKAIFLDRDGTINELVGFLTDINLFNILPGVSEAIRKINKSSFLVIVVTNQPVIARGELTIEGLNNIHKKMETILGQNGAYIDGIYYCPHHPDRGFEGERPDLKIDCNCRKPKPGLLLKAAQDYNIDLSESYMIGDSENDIKAGKAAGCKTILLNNKKQYGQDYSFNSLKECIDELIKNNVI